MKQFEVFNQSTDSRCHIKINTRNTKIFRIQRLRNSDILLRNFYYGIKKIIHIFFKCIFKRGIIFQQFLFFQFVLISRNCSNIANERVHSSAFTQLQIAPVTSLQDAILIFF